VIHWPCGAGRGIHAPHERRRTPQCRAGFTLIELLVVIAIFGLMLGLATLASRPDASAKLQRDAERLRVLFALAAEEAELRARPMAWQADADGYAFLEGGRNGWVPLPRDDQFRPRAWEAGRVHVVLLPPLEGRAGQQAQAWVEFARDGVQRPFVLHLDVADNGSDRTGGWDLRGDSRGRYAIAARL